MLEFIQIQTLTMLNKVSWDNFLSGIFIITTIYYLVVTITYFHTELAQILSGNFKIPVPKNIKNILTRKSHFNNSKPNIQNCNPNTDEASVSHQPNEGP